MTLALVAASAAAVSSGAAAILQAKAVARPRVRDRIGPALALDLARSPTYLAGLVLVACGSLLSVVALRDLPVFVVAVLRAAGLGVTALLAWPLLGVRIRRRDGVALLALGLGLGVVVTAGADGGAVDVPGLRRWLPLAGLAVVAVAALAVERRRDPRSGVVLAALAGVDFAAVQVAVRMMDLTDVGSLLRDPAFWGIAAGAHGLAVQAVALQRTTVTSATAALVGVETLTGAGVGLLLLGDSPRAGWEAAAAAGFVLALAGALGLAGSDSTRATARDDRRGVSPRRASPEPTSRTSPGRP